MKFTKAIFVFFAFFALPNSNSLLFSIDMKTKIGPCISCRKFTYIDRITNRGSYRTHLLNVYFKGLNSSYIWHASYCPTPDEWRNWEQIHDQNETSWAFTNCEPFIVDKWLIYLGHNNHNIWYTRWLDDREETAWTHNVKWETPKHIPESDGDGLSRHAPAASLYYDQYFRPNRLNIVIRKASYDDSDGNIVLWRAHIFRDGRVSDDWSKTCLPNNIKTEIGPTMAFGHIFYRGSGDDSQIYAATTENEFSGRWIVSSIPRAFTNSTPAAIYYQCLSHRRYGIILVYSGHNNKNLWLCFYDSYTKQWHRLGYIQGVATDSQQRPALAMYGCTLYLAFKSLHQDEICVGTLEIDFENQHDTPGHTFNLIRNDNPDLCCSLDCTPPEISLLGTGLPNSVRLGSSIRIAARVNDPTPNSSGINWVKLYLNNLPESDGIELCTLTSTPMMYFCDVNIDWLQGDHKLYIIAQDNAGNRNYIEHEIFVEGGLEGRR